MPSAAQLAGMRARFASRTMPDSCTVRRTSGQSNTGWGGVEAESTDDAGTYPCSYTVTSGNERMAGGKPIAQGQPLITLPHDADVDEKDFLYVELAGGARKTIQVTAVLETSPAIAKRVLGDENRG